MLISKRMGWLALGLLVPGCEAEVVDSSECRSAHASALEAFEGASLDMETFATAQRAAVATSCAAIAEGLGLGATPLSDPATTEETQAACDQANSALDNADLSLEVSGGSCVADAAVETACLEACGSTASPCDGACEARALFSATCTPPTVTVISSDPDVVATLEANLPAILSFRDAASLHFADGAGAFASFATTITTQWLDEGCDQDAERLVDVFERAGAASTEWSELLDATQTLPPTDG